MDSSRWQAIRNMYHAALDLSADERAAFFRRAGDADDEVLSRVEALLRQAAGAGPFLEPPSSENFDLLSSTVTLTAAPAEPGMKLGGYTVRRVVGAGGMGIVHEAEQDNPRRRVALKLVQPTLVSPNHYRRLEFEAQVLGRLQHPGIAQIFEAGTVRAPWGLVPFFAMEFVEGQPITEYARRQALRSRERLELLVRVCEAVEHAHQKGVIHRDLKPGNILVTASGQIKILDFGVARVVDPDAAGVTRQTELGQILGTLPYMSAEQVRGDPAAIDTRSDVYALGVIGYELLTERLPHDLSHMPLPEAIRVIQEATPTSPRWVNRSIDEDASTVISKAIEKDKNRRYGSASELGADIRRYLRHEPITARPSGAGYRLRKLVARHKALSATVALSLLSLAGFSVSMAWLYARANKNLELARAAELREKRAAEQARTEATTAARARDLLAGLFTFADPRERPPDKTTVRDMLADARRRIDAELAEEPLLRAGVLTMMSSVHANVGDSPQAVACAEEAVRLRRELLGPADTATAESLEALANARKENGNFAGAIEASNEALRIVGRAPEVDPSRLARAIGNHGWYKLKMGDYPGAEQFMQDALARFRQLPDPPALELGNLLAALGQLDEMRGRYGEAERYLREALMVLRGAYGAEHLRIATTLNDLASVVESQGNYAQAIQLYEESLALRRKLYPEDPHIMVTQNNLAHLMITRGEFGKAEPLVREILAIRRRDLPPLHMDLAVPLNHLGAILEGLGRHKEALAAIQESLDIRRKSLPAGHPDIAAALNTLAGPLKAQRRFGEAEQALLESLEIRRAASPGPSPSVATALNNLGHLYLAQERYVNARAALEEALAIRRGLLPATHPKIANTLINIADADLGLREYAAAENHLREALHILESVPGNANQTHALCLGRMARAQAGQDRFAEAEPLFRRAAAIYEAVNPPAARRAALVRCEWADSLGRLGRHAEGHAVLRTGFDILERSRYSHHPDARRFLNKTVSIVRAWQSADPQVGHAEIAAEWSSKLAAWSTTTQQSGGVADDAGAGNEPGDSSTHPPDPPETLRSAG